MEKEKNGIPVYDVVLGDWDEGVFATSLVGTPAIGSDFIFFSEEETKILLFSDEEKREVVGAIMIPDILMPRKNPETGEIYNVRFSKEVISQLNEKMKDYGYDKSFTFFHKYSAQGNVKLLESWIKEFDEDKSNSYGFDLPIGTMFMKVKVEEDNLWEMVKENKLNGFSIELNASYKLNEELTKEQEDMSKLNVFSNNLEVGDITLAFDGEETISDSTVLFQYVKETVDEKEVETLTPFTGDFELEDNTYKVVNGIPTIEAKVVEEPEVEEKEELFDKEELMKDISAEITKQLQPIVDMFNKIDGENASLSENMEKVILLQNQGNLAKPAGEPKKPQKEVVNRAENLSKLNSWVAGRKKVNNKK